MTVFMRLPSLLLLCAAMCAACSDGDVEPSPPADAGTDAEPDPNNLCPDPDHPRVHYLSASSDECAGVVLDCTTDQNGFQTSCGCGCIDKGDPLCPVIEDPSITWESQDPSECAPEPPVCPPSEFGFSNSCGCGCKLPGG